MDLVSFLVKYLSKCVRNRLILDKKRSNFFPQILRKRISKPNSEDMLKRITDEVECLKKKILQSRLSESREDVKVKTLTKSSSIIGLHSANTPLKHTMHKASGRFFADDGKYASVFSGLKKFLFFVLLFFNLKTKSSIFALFFVSLSLIIHEAITDIAVNYLNELLYKISVKEKNCNSNSIKCSNLRIQSQPRHFHVLL